MGKKRPTSDAIKAEIAWLKTNKKFIPSHSGFGDNHWESIDAQITVLEEDLTEDDIYDRSCEDGEDPEEMGVEWSYNQRENALYARQWLDGDEMAPSENWGPLVKKD